MLKFLVPTLPKLLPTILIAASIFSAFLVAPVIHQWVWDQVDSGLTSEIMIDLTQKQEKLGYEPVYSSIEPAPSISKDQVERAIGLEKFLQLLFSVTLGYLVSCFLERRASYGRSS